MATGDPRKRTKNPMFVQYANGWEHLQAKTPENLRWAWDVSMTAFGALHGLGGNMWNQEEAWEWLREHHREFRAFLDGIIGSQDAPARITPEMMRTLTEHCAHVRLESKWDGWPAKVREQLPQRWAKRRPAVEAVVYARLLATTPPEHHADLSLPTTTPPEYKPSPRYVETSTPQDPLDGLYLNLRVSAAWGARSPTPLSSVSALFCAGNETGAAVLRYPMSSQSQFDTQGAERDVSTRAP